MLSQPDSIKAASNGCKLGHHPVKVLPFNYVGHIVEHGLTFHTVRLASGALVIAPVSFVETVEPSSSEINDVRR